MAGFESAAMPLFGAVDPEKLKFGIYIGIKFVVLEFKRARQILKVLPCNLFYNSNTVGPRKLRFRI